MRQGLKDLLVRGVNYVFVALDGKLKIFFALLLIPHITFFMSVPFFFVFYMARKYPEEVKYDRNTEYSMILKYFTILLFIRFRFLKEK